MQSDLTAQPINPLPPFDLSALHAEIRQKFAAAERIALAAHIRPDGDAVGSLLGLGLALQAKGKQVQMILLDGVPGNLRYLYGSQQIRRKLPEEADLYVTVDSSELARIGGVFGERKPDIQIDHHITNTLFANTNFVIGDAVATCAILAEYLPEWGLEFDQNIAAALLTGILTDTIGFRTSNMTPAALHLAAKMMEHGANLPDLYAQSLTSKTYEAVRYWAMGLDKIQREDGLVWTSLSLADRQKAEYPGNDDADLVNVLSSIDSKVAVIFVEQKADRVKISWRAKLGCDVSQIALQFGGGGHAAAAGAEVNGSLESVQERVIQATCAFLAALQPETSDSQPQ